MRSAARKYYAAYHQAMRAIVLPGLDTRFRVPSRRMVAARVKLRLLLDSPVSKAHADASYVDTLIEMFLQETLADKAFSRYRREGIVYPVAAKKIFHHRFSTTTFDPGPLVQAIKAASGPERNVLVYEYCLSRNFAGSDIGDVCSAASIEALFGQRSFATASLKFAFLLDFMNRHPNPHDPHHMWPKGPIEAVLVKNDENAALIEEAKQTFQSLRESAESSLEAESSFLNDDILFLAYRFTIMSANRRKPLRACARSSRCLSRMQIMPCWRKPL